MDGAKPAVTPKDFFLWVGAMFALYVGVFNYIALLWDYINYALPNPLTQNGYVSYSSDPYQAGISWEMASLIILTPTFLALMWLIRRDIVRDASRAEVWVRRWALYVTLFVAGATIVGDLIYVVYAFLNGTDLTTQFLLKALVVLMVAAVGFMHFLADLWGYWAQYPARNRAVSAGVLALVLVSIVSGFFIVGTPGQARLYRYDDKKVYDLQTIEYLIGGYYQRTEKLPATFTDINKLNAGIDEPAVINDAQTNQPYGYRITGATSYELCAVFNTQSHASNYSTSSYLATPPHVNSQENWQHGAGQVCFERTIDPELYPPFTKQAPAVQ